MSDSLKRFEEWAADLNMDLARTALRESTVYSDCNTDYAWMAWQAAQLAAPTAPEVWCGCGDQIMPDDGARCGTCVAVKTAFPQGERN